MFQRHTDIARPLAIIDFNRRTSKAISYRNGGQFKFIPPFWNENSSRTTLLLFENILEQYFFDEKKFQSI